MEVLKYDMMTLYPNVLKMGWKEAYMQDEGEYIFALTTGIKKICCLVRKEQIFFA